MIGSKKFIRRAKKWQNVDDMSGKKISLPTSPKFSIRENGKKAPVASRGYFVTKTADNMRFLVPLTFLKNRIFVELLKLSEEEYGVTSDGPIMMPWDSRMMRYILLLIQQGKEAEQVLLDILTSTC